MTELDCVRDRYRPTNRFALGILGVRIAVCTNDDRVASRLAGYFAPYVSSDAAPDATAVYVLQGDPILAAEQLRDVVPGRPGKSPKDAFYDTPDGRVVLKRRTGVAIYVAEPDHYVVGNVVRHVHQVVNAITMVFAKAMMRRGYMMLHASAVLGPAGGVGFTGGSGVGKSTMALALIERGYRFITNDRLLVRAVSGPAEMAGLPKLPRVNPGTLLKLPRLRGMVASPDRERYERLPPAALWAVEEKRDVDVDGIFGWGTRQVAGILRVLYVLHWDPRGEGWAVRPLDPASRLAALRRRMKGLGVYDLRPPGTADQETALEAVANAITAYEVAGRTDVLELRTLILGHHLANSSGRL